MTEPFLFKVPSKYNMDSEERQFWEYLISYIEGTRRSLESDEDMQTTKNIIEPSLLSDSVAVYYSVPDNTSTTITRVVLSNTGAGAVVVNLYTPSNATLDSDANLLAPISVGANSTVVVSDLEGYVMSSGSTIRASAATADVINIRASGIEIV